MKIINSLRDESNLAGLNLILIIPAIACGNFPFADVTNFNSIDVSSIDLETYTKWIPIQHTLDTGELKEESEIGDQGPLHKYSIECVIPKDYIYRHQQFQELLQLDHLVIAKDNNDQYRLIGYTEDVFYNKGMQVKWKFSSGKGSKGFNGYQLTFYFESNRKALPVTGMDSLEIETAFLV